MTNTERNADDAMQAHRDAAWNDLLRIVNETTATTAKALFSAGWDAAMFAAAQAIRDEKRKAVQS